MKQLWMSGAAAVMALSIANVGAQTPQTQAPPTQPPAQAAAPATAAPMHEGPITTVQGCVYKEQDVPGRTPNIAEKAGVMEDYILVTSANTSATPAGTSGTTPPAATEPAAAPASMAYKLEKIADERLKAVVGKRVEVTGRVDADKHDMAATATTGAPAKDKGLGPDKIELPEFEVTSLREVEGTCPAMPQVRK